MVIIRSKYQIYVIMLPEKGVEHNGESQTGCLVT